MADVLIRNISDRTMKRLKAAAKQHRRSLQAEALDVLEQAAERYRDTSRAPRAEIRLDEIGEREGTLARLERELSELRQQMDELKRSLPPLHAIGRIVG
jgi:plasmid stability protein